MQPDLLKFVCPLCGRAAGVPVAMANRKVKCPSCQGVIRAPAAPSMATAAQPAPPAYSIVASTPPPPFRRTRAGGKRSAAVFIAIGLVCVVFFTMLIIAVKVTNKNAPRKPVADASASDDKTITPGTMPPAPISTAPPMPEEAEKPLDPSIKSGDGTVRIAGLAFDGSGTITGATRTAKDDPRLVGFVPTYDVIEETTTMRSRPSLLVRSTGEGKGMLQFSISAVFSGHAPNGLDRAKVFVELTAISTDWQNQEVGPALGLLLQWEDQQAEFPIEFKTPLDSVGGQPAMRLSYLLTEQQFEQIAKSRSGAAFIQNQQFNLADEHLQSCKRLYQYLKTGNPS